MQLPPLSSPLYQPRRAPHSKQHDVQLRAKKRVGYQIQILTLQKEKALMKGSVLYNEGADLFSNSSNIPNAPLFLSIDLDSFPYCLSLLCLRELADVSAQILQSSLDSLLEGRAVGGDPLPLTILAASVRDAVEVGRNGRSLRHGKSFLASGKGHLRVLLVKEDALIYKKLHFLCASTLFVIVHIHINSCYLTQIYERKVPTTTRRIKYTTLVSSLCR